MLERGTPAPESVALPPTIPTDRGSERFNWRRAFKGAVIGGIALPALSLGAGYLMGVLTNIPDSEVAPLVKVVLLQVATGAGIGGVALGAPRS